MAFSACNKQRRSIVSSPVTSGKFCAGAAIKQQPNQLDVSLRASDPEWHPVGLWVLAIKISSFLLNQLLDPFHVDLFSILFDLTQELARGVC
jgi:hypothetical protein